jgi:NAD(P) transhydrogenase subunit alpha
MRIGVAKETFPGERRVALVPASVGPLKKAGHEVVVESAAGGQAGYTDEQYAAAGATLVQTRVEALGADCLVQVRALGANPQSGEADLEYLRAGQLVIGLCEPLTALDAVQRLASKGVTLLALELIPRITRAQSMDVLSSQATVAGYRAVILAAEALPKMFPMLMTAAGTITAAKVLVIGAGVAGLQAIAVARKLGGVVSGYDVRPAVKEQVQSLGAKFVELALDTSDTEGKGGYAKAQSEEFLKRQSDLLGHVIAQQDVVVTTAAIPGKPSPRLIFESAVSSMRPGSVIVDLAAERGGNCELTVANERVVRHGVTILGPTNLPAEVPHDASQMFAKNVVTLIGHLAPKGELKLDMADEITRETTATHGGEVTQARLRELLQLPPLSSPTEEAKQ